MKKIITSFVLLVSTLVCLGSCSSNNADESLFDKAPTTFDHYYSNKISFADMQIDINKKTFLQDRVEKVKIKSVTDGDSGVSIPKNLIVT